MSEKLNSEISVIGIDIGKNSFHLVGQDRRGRIVLRQKWSRGQVEARLANLPPCSPIRYAAPLANTTLAEFIHAAALCIANFGSEDTAVAVVGRRAREWRAARRASLAGAADR